VPGTRVRTRVLCTRLIFLDPDPWFLETGTRTRSRDFRMLGPGPASLRSFFGFLRHTFSNFWYLKTVFIFSQLAKFFRLSVQRKKSILFMHFKLKLKIFAELRKMSRISSTVWQTWRCATKCSGFLSPKTVAFELEGPSEADFAFLFQDCPAFETLDEIFSLQCN